MSELHEKISELSEKDLGIMESVQNWLIKNRGYKEYDFTDDFNADKILPILKMIEHGELIFDENTITQKLRIPLELTNNKGDVVREITELTYKARYQDRELQNEAKGINVSKEPMKYINAQIAMLTSQAQSVISKLYDVDSNNTKLVSALYFLG